MKIAGLISLIAFIVLASECELTLTNLIIKAVALATLAVVAIVSSREPAKVPARRMR